MKTIVKTNEKQTILLLLPCSLTKAGVEVKLTKKQAAELMKLVELTAEPRFNIKSKANELNRNGLQLTKQLSDTAFTYYQITPKPVRYKAQKTLFETNVIELKFEFFND